MAEKKGGGSSFFTKAMAFVLFAIFLRSYWESFQFNPVWIYPYLMLYTPYRNETYEAWQKYAPINTKIVYNSMAIPEISAHEFTFEAFREATHNFRYPAVVRGLFNGTVAVEKWKEREYLPGKLGDFVIPIVRNGVVGTLQDDRALVNFADSYRDLWDKEYAKEYIFFPVKSRFTFNGSDAGSAVKLQQAVDQICRDDLDLNRIWRGFSTKTHNTFMGAQLIVGKSTPEFTSNSTGSDWHCAGGNNWFIQVAGKKYWEFIEPRHSPYMSPLRGGLFNMWTGNKQMAAVQKHIPRKHCILEAGDMLYNPDWTWHKITNYGGLSIGIPIRESNKTLSLQNNWYFTSILVTNKVLHNLGMSLGGFPPPSFATEADN